MTKEQAIKLAGSQSNLARLLGISRGAVNQWAQIPQGRLYQLMVLKPDWFTGLLTNEETGL
jgi:predicted transcriptional regulator